MKSFFRLAGAVTVAVLVSSTAPIASAQPRAAGSRDLKPKIVRIIKTIQKLFGVSGHTDGLIPPRPEPTPTPTNP